MPMTQSEAAKGREKVPYGECYGGVIARRFTKSVVAADVTLNNIIELGVLPSFTRVVDMILDSDDLDTNGAPTLSLDVGFMSGEVGVNDALRTSGAEFFAGSIAARTGVVERMSLKTGFRTGVSEAARSIGVKVTAVPATFAAGQIGLTVLYAAD